MDTFGPCLDGVCSNSMDCDNTNKGSVEAIRSKRMVVLHEGLRLLSIFRHGRLMNDFDAINLLVIGLRMLRCQVQESGVLEKMWFVAAPCSAISAGTFAEYHSAGAAAMWSVQMMPQTRCDNKLRVSRLSSLHSKRTE